VLKLVDDDAYPLVYAKCSNGYTMIDYDLDSDWEMYLSSFRQFHYAVAGPVKDDHVNWEGWFLGSADAYIVSPKCDVCDESETMNYESTESTYYMTDVARGCVHAKLGTAACDLLWDTYECQYCLPEATYGYYSSQQFYNGYSNSEDDEGLLLQSDLDGNYFHVGVCPFMVEKATKSVLAADAIERCTTLLL
jgi:hypothetical protein